MELNIDLPVHTLARATINGSDFVTDAPTKDVLKNGDWISSEQDTQVKRRGSVQEGNDLALRPLSRNRPTLQNGPEADDEVGREQGALTVDEEPSIEYLDGGFGWAIVASTFVITFHFLGFLYSWGVIQADLLGKGLASSQLLSVVGGLQAFWNAAGCIPAAWVIQKIGVRKTTLFGVVLNSLAVLLASFSTESLGGLIFLQGVVAGIACGTLFMAVYPLPSQYFMRKRGIATGITSCGGGVGGAAWSLIIQKLIDKFGLPWAYRFMALSFLVFGIPAALILKEGVVRPRRQAGAAEKEQSIYRSSMFIRLVIACFVVSYPFFIPAFFIPQYTISLGYSSSTGALFGAIYNVASGIGRLGFGIIADFVVGSSIVAQIVGSHRVNQAIGVIELASSIGFLAGPISGGALLDAFGGPSAGAEAYKPAMYLVGGTTFVSVILAVWIRASYSRKLFVKA
ncbi:hypothetical protein QFC24_000028 [Naganishia onofrii]|uniref:Uncharacterized protein n=1 Tax=Naganishia onofrii TaxID=1851511 RepID=A0ACC2XVU8_9TREE|nr:hypothetical protein QFC24_000028 [Naganishia onofrii]